MENVQIFLGSTRGLKLPEPDKELLKRLTYRCGSLMRNLNKRRYSRVLAREKVFYLLKATYWTIEKIQEKKCRVRLTAIKRQLETWAEKLLTKQYIPIDESDVDDSHLTMDNVSFDEEIWLNRTKPKPLSKLYPNMEINLIAPNTDKDEVEPTVITFGFDSTGTWRHKSSCKRKIPNLYRKGPQYYNSISSKDDEQKNKDKENKLDKCVKRFRHEQEGFDKTETDKDTETENKAEKNGIAKDDVSSDDIFSEEDCKDSESNENSDADDEGSSGNCYSDEDFKDDESRDADDERSGDDCFSDEYSEDSYEKYTDSDDSDSTFGSSDCCNLQWELLNQSLRYMASKRKKLNPKERLKVGSKVMILDELPKKLWKTGIIARINTNRKSSKGIVVINENGKKSLRSADELLRI